MRDTYGVVAAYSRGRGLDIVTTEHVAFEAAFAAYKAAIEAGAWCCDLVDQADEIVAEYARSKA